MTTKNSSKNILRNVFKKYPDQTLIYSRIILISGYIRIRFLLLFSSSLCKSFLSSLLKNKVTYSFNSFKVISFFDY
jgi:hypothetical protein